MKPTTRDALAGLRALGIRVIMLTGDEATNALATGRELGLTSVDVMAGVLPEGKARAVADLKRQGEVVAMASTTRRRWPWPTSASRWAPATDVAIGSAGVMLVEGDLRGIVRAIHLGAARSRTLRSGSPSTTSARSPVASI